MTKMRMPCLNCLTYALCRAQILSHPKSPWVCLRDELSMKCHLIFKYISQGSKRLLPVHSQPEDDTAVRMLSSYPKPAMLLQEMENFLCNGYWSEFEIEPKKKKYYKRPIWINTRS